MRRTPVMLLILLGLSKVAAAGGYVIEAFGGADYQGDLARYGSAPRLQIGGGVSRGPWAIELTYAGTIPDLFYIDCYGAECAAAAAPQLELGSVNLDVRRAWRVIYSTWTNKIGLDLVLHGGPRWFGSTGGDSFALPGYHGLGIGGGAGIDLNLKIISYYLDTSLDLVELHGGDNVYLAKIPTISIGARVGWM